MSEVCNVSEQCSMPSCDQPPRQGQRYCGTCHSKYMKIWRAKRKREQEQLQQSVVKMRARLVAQQQKIAELEVG